MHVFITGSSRGLGLQFTKDLLARGEHVFATCRQPDRAEALQRLAEQHPDRLDILALDVTDPASIQAAATAVAARTDALDLLINNAGINRPASSQSLRGITFDTMLEVLHTNTAAPVMVTQALLDLLIAAGGAKVINLTSGLGSIGEMAGGGNYAYATSKAGLNMVTKLLANDLARHQIVAVVFDPGWVKTDMGGPAAHITPETSISGMLRVIDGLTLAETGRFYLYDGSQRAW